MDLHLSREQEMLRKMYRDFAENEVKPLAEWVDENEAFPEETVKKMAKLGMISYKGYATSPIVNFTTMALIVLSGLGFLVWHDIGKNVFRVWKQKLPKKRMWTRLRVQSKIVLVMTGFLIFFGMIGFFFLEYHNPETMGTMSAGEKLMASAFQSVTSRTAGFAAVSQGDLTPASKLLGCILMFIGGSPGGTAGGVKTTTVALLLLVCISVLRGSKMRSVSAERSLRQS